MKLRRSSSPPRQRLRTEVNPASNSEYSKRREFLSGNTGRGDERRTAAALRSKQFWLQRFGLIILSIAVIVSLVNIMTLSPTAHVIVLSDSQSNQVLDGASLYQAAANHFLSDSIWNRDKLTIDTNKISAQMLAQFPELNGASVTIPLMAHDPIIYVQPSQPALILVNSSGAYALDANGKALIKASSSAALNLPSLPVVNDQSGLSVVLGKQIIPASDISFIQTVKIELASQGVTVSSLTLPSGTDELDVGLTGKAYYAKFNLQNDDPRQQAGTLIAAMNQLKTQNVTPAKYIDVRVDGRAYYE